MRLIGLNLLHAFCEKHTDCRSWVENWVADIKASQWDNLNDLKYRYPSASILTGGVAIFNVKGNNYRLVVQVAVATQIVLVKWIGTHAEYSRRNF
jgi:mRNA interferase HigB